MQGEYINWLNPKAATIFQVSFAHAKTDAERKTLVKMVRIWDLFVSKRLLLPILNSTDFNEAYYRLLTKKDRQVISEYKHAFYPNCLPKSIERSGKFYRGDRSVPKHSSMTPAIHRESTMSSTASA